jgi:hypothetical protein
VTVDKREARDLLNQTVERLRAQTYGELLRYREPETFEVVGGSGTGYQLEIEAIWDDKRKRTLRVMAAIDDGGWRAYFPLSDDFIVAPDGSFVGEGP